MYLYTARFSRRRCESERGTDVREHPNTRVFAVVLSHSRIYLRGWLFWGGLWVEGKGPQPKVLYLNEPRHSPEPLWGGIQKKRSLVLFYLLIEFDVNECIPFTRHSSLWDGQDRGFKVRRKKTKRASKSRSWSSCSDVIGELRGGLGGIRSGQGRVGQGRAGHRSRVVGGVF